jgi:hypothetical protein
MNRRAELANAYAQAGKTEQAREILQEFLLAPSGTYISPYAWATLYAGMERKEDTIEWLQKGYEERNARMVNLAVHPVFVFLRGDAGFEKLLARMNVPPHLRHAVTSQPAAKPQTKR